MSTEIAPIPHEPNGLAPNLPEMTVSTRLSDAIQTLRRPHPDIGTPASYDATTQRHAAAALTRLAPWAEPVTEAVLRAWLAPIPLVVRNEKSPEAIAGWVAGIALAIGHFEIGAFNATTQREALQTFKFFPSAADVCEVVSPVAVHIRQTVRHLRTICEAPTTGSAA